MYLNTHTYANAYIHTHTLAYIHTHYIEMLSTANLHNESFVTPYSYSQQTVVNEAE